MINAAHFDAIREEVLRDVWTLKNLQANLRRS
jgi:hypothetical protein